jgi:hypothetical protein
MMIKGTVLLSAIAFAAVVCLVACTDFAFHVATYPEDAIGAPQGPTPTWDYENTVNPATNIRTSGPYDIEDLYRDKNGFPLPGARQIR